jgi:hypothetical protein
MRRREKERKINVAVLDFPIRDRGMLWRMEWMRLVEMLMMSIHLGYMRTPSDLSCLQGEREPLVCSEIKRLSSIGQKAAVPKVSESSLVDSHPTLYRNEGRISPSTACMTIHFKLHQDRREDAPVSM